jgi:DNA-binding response OmpR family regulator/DNA-binding CsgD family transcriptional regulator
MSKTILIIEDEKTLREEMSDVLGFEGYDVLQADNGKDGLKLARENYPDLILCDIMMPQMKGTKVLQSLMEHENTRHIPFIFITALSERTDIRSGMESGADDYLVKPFSVSELLGSIRSRLGKTEARQKLLDNTVTSVKKGLSKHVSQLHEKIIDQSNVIDLMRLEKKIQVTKADEREMMSGTFNRIDADNRFHNIGKIVNKELRTKCTTKSTEQILIKLQNEMNKQNFLDNRWSHFQLAFNQLYPLSSPNLTNRVSNLHQSEIALASAIELNLSSLQIASLLNITQASVRKNKYRLKKKLGLNKEDDLKEAIHGFMTK